MKTQKPLTNKNGEVRPLTKKDVEGFQAFDDLPKDMKAKLRGRPKLAKPKQAVNIRLSPEVIEHFKGTGLGWQTRIDALLLKHVSKRR